MSNVDEKWKDWSCDETPRVYHEQASCVVAREDKAVRSCAQEEPTSAALQQLMPRLRRPRPLNWLQTARKLWHAACCVETRNQLTSLCRRSPHELAETVIPLRELVDPFAKRHWHRRSIGIFACALGAIPHELNLILKAAMVASDARACGNTFALSFFDNCRVLCAESQGYRAWQLAAC